MNITNNKILLFRTRLYLAISYVLLIELALVPFSINYYISHTKDLEKIVLRQEFGNNVPKKLEDDEYIFVQSQIEELRSRAIINLIFLNVGMIVATSALTYFYSYYALKPISEALNREKEFVSNASHELRTPITSIIMASEIALRAKETDVEDLKQTLQQINNTGQYAGKLINEMLELSRIEAGNIVTRKDEINLVSLLGEITKEVEAVAQDKAIKINLVMPTKAVYISNDRNLVKELIIIYLENAIKYSNQNSTIDITLAGKNGRTLTIKDYGIGIAPEDLSKIKDKFFRGNAARNFSEGSGLGLTLAEKIIQKTGVHARINSVVDNGTEITVEL